MQAWWSAELAENTAPGTRGSPGQSACGTGGLRQAAGPRVRAARQAPPAALLWWARAGGEGRGVGGVLVRFLSLPTSHVQPRPLQRGVPLLSHCPKSGILQGGAQPGLHPTTPASNRGAGASSARPAGQGGSAVQTPPQLPLRLRQEVQGIRAFKRLFGDMAGRQRRRMAVAVLLRCAEEGHWIKLEQQTADQLGGDFSCQAPCLLPACLPACSTSVSAHRGLLQSHAWHFCGIRHWS